MNCHLVAVEVCVERGTNERVDFNGSALDKHGLERLNGKSVQRRRTVQTGAEAVAVAQRRGYKVVPLIGPSSILLALMASGFNGQTFAFAGYLPVDAGARTARLREMQRRIERERQTQIFIETPYRNSRLIDDLCRTLPSTMLLCVASDITGPSERIITRPLSWWKQQPPLERVPAIFLLYS